MCQIQTYVYICFLTCLKGIADSSVICLFTSRNLHFRVILTRQNKGVFEFTNVVVSFEF